ncbi:Fc receptor-like protein 2 isoform X2 [Alligator mississippiensis]|uniref:Fc receptor-like protein 2 isoform X2 n=1 Tax=Alligator mississippiensis TaxID=8496 RepID=UPI0028777858|nr:Fc receptor-like protein 2 isoform X2 [Alligator mississippiensis]
MPARLGVNASRVRCLLSRSAGQGVNAARAQPGHRRHGLEGLGGAGTQQGSQDPSEVMGPKSAPRAQGQKRALWAASLTSWREQTSGLRWAGSGLPSALRETQTSPASMLCLVIFAAHALGLAAAQKAVLTLNPPWSTVFRGESVTLSCNGSRPPGSTPTSWCLEGYSWISTETNLQIKAAQMEDAGKYQCKTSDSTWSDHIELTVSSGWLILQAPHYAVFEGDRLLLRCRVRRGGEVYGMRYYRDGTEITPKPVQSSYTIDQAKTTDSGTYRCEGEILSGSLYFIRYSNEVLVLVQELFSTPELKVAGSAEAREESPLTLRCVTQPKPWTSDLQLQYSFCKSSMIVRGPESSPVHHIPAASLADSGPYFCVVQTVTSSVRKQSPEQGIKVKRVPVSGVTLGVQPRNGQVVAGERLVLNCSVAAGTGPLTFSWHWEGSGLALRTETLHSRRMDYEIPAATESDAGEYYCAASNGHNRVLSPRVTVTVWVPVTGANIIRDKPELVLTVGESLNLSCSVQAGTDAAFRWLHNAQELDVASGLGLLSPVGHVLYVESVQLGHAGNYQCIASNQFSLERVFQASSEILAVTVREDASTWVAVGVTVTLLCLVGATVAAVVCVRRHQKAEEICFTAWWRSTPGPVQQEPPAHGLLPPATLGSSELELEYANVCPQEQTSSDVVYSVVSIQKGSGAKPTGTSQMDNGHLVTYAALCSPKPSWDSATKVRASEVGDQSKSDIYETITHL